MNGKKFNEYWTKYNLIQMKKVANGDFITLFDLGNEYVVWNYYPENDCFLVGRYFLKRNDEEIALIEAERVFEAAVKQYNKYGA